MSESDDSLKSDDSLNMRPRQKQQRTLEEALAGRPARKYKKNPSGDEPMYIDGKRYCPGEIKGKWKRKDGGGWFVWATDPTHPKYTPELAKKHYLAVQKKGRMGAAARRSVPKGWAAREWRPIFKERVEQSMTIVDKMIDQELIVLPDNELDAKAAKEAIVFNMALVRSPEVTLDNRLKASRNILDYCKSKPVAKSQVEIKTPEQWLEELTKDM